MLSIILIFVPKSKAINYIINKIDLMFCQQTSIDSLIGKLCENDNLNKALRFAFQNFNVNENDLKTLSPTFILQHFQKESINKGLIQKNEDQTPISNYDVQEFWQSNEFKLFSWISVCHSFIENRTISAFNQADFLFLQSLFIKKSHLFLQYQLLGLQKQSKRKNDDWEEEEVALLTSIIKQEKNVGKWSDISFSLFCQSNKKYFRNSHKCREKWFNYLNPVVNHDKWTLEEDCELFKIAGKLGTKWAKISKAMDGVRTEHMVKNRFNSIAKQYQNRFQRCSKHKMIQNIGKDLKNKLANYIAKQQAALIEVIEQNCIQNKDQNSIFSSQLQVSLNNQQKIAQKLEQNYQTFYNTIEDNVEDLVCFVDEYGTMMDFNVVNPNNKIELVDYISMDFQFKKTIFSSHQ